MSKQDYMDTVGKKVKRKKATPPEIECANNQYDNSTNCHYTFTFPEPNYNEFEFCIDGKIVNFINKEWLTKKINTELATRQGRLKIERKNKEQCAIIKAEIETLKDILYLINNVI